MLSTTRAALRIHSTRSWNNVGHKCINTLSLIDNRREIKTTSHQLRNLEQNPSRFKTQIMRIVSLKNIHRNSFKRCRWWNLCLLEKRGLNEWKADKREEVQMSICHIKFSPVFLTQYLASSFLRFTLHVNTKRLVLSTCNSQLFLGSKCWINFNGGVTMTLQPTDFFCAAISIHMQKLFSVYEFLFSLFCVFVSVLLENQRNQEQINNAEHAWSFSQFVNIRFFGGSQFKFSCFSVTIGRRRGAESIFKST